MSMSMSMSMHTSIDRGGAFSGRRAEGKSPEKRTDTCQSACSHRCAPRGREGRRGRRNGAQSARAPPKGVSEKRALCSRSAATSRTHPAPQHVPSAKRGVSRPWKMRPGVALHHAVATSRRLVHSARRSQTRWRARPGAIVALARPKPRARHTQPPHASRVASGRQTRRRARAQLPAGNSHPAAITMHSTKRPRQPRACAYHARGAPQSDRCPPGDPSRGGRPSERAVP